MEKASPRLELATVNVKLNNSKIVNKPKSQ